MYRSNEESNEGEKDYTGNKNHKDHKGEKDHLLHVKTAIQD